MSTSILRPASVNIEIPPEFKCPITQDLMIYPIRTNCFHAFEKSAIERWVTQNGTCPNCRVYITTIIPDQDLTRRIEIFVRENNLIDDFNEIKDALPRNIQPITTSTRPPSSSAFFNFNRDINRALNRALNERGIQRRMEQNRRVFFQKVAKILSVVLLILGIFFISRMLLKIVFVPIALLLKKANV